MKINLDKTNVVGFRNGGRTAKKNHFYYLGHKTDFDLYYRYLDLILNFKSLNQNSWH